MHTIWQNYDHNVRQFQTKNMCINIFVKLMYLSIHNTRIIKEIYLHFIGNSTCWIILVDHTKLSTSYLYPVQYGDYEWRNVAREIWNIVGT